MQVSLNSKSARVWTVIGSVFLVCLVVAIGVLHPNAIPTKKLLQVGFWTTSFEQTNEVSCSNPSGSSAHVFVTFKSKNGAPVLQHDLTLQAWASQTLDTEALLKAKSEFGSYFVEGFHVEGTPDLGVSCTNFQKRNASKKEARVDFAYSSPAFTPDGLPKVGIIDSANQNFLTVSNTASTPFAADVEIYSADGNLQSVENTSLANLKSGETVRVELKVKGSKSKRASKKAKGKPQTKRTSAQYVYRIVPRSQNLSYVATLTQYRTPDIGKSKVKAKSKRVIEFAYVTTPQNGTLDPEPLFVSLIEASSIDARVVNPNSTATGATFELRSEEGELVRSENVALAPFSLQTFTLTDDVTEGQFGSFRLKSTDDNPQPLIASIVHTKTKKNRSLWAYASETFGTKGFSGAPLIFPLPTLSEKDFLELASMNGSEDTVTLGGISRDKNGTNIAQIPIGNLRSLFSDRTIVASTTEAKLLQTNISTDSASFSGNLLVTLPGKKADYVTSIGALPTSSELVSISDSDDPALGSRIPTLDWNSLARTTAILPNPSCSASLTQFSNKSKSTAYALQPGMTLANINRQRLSLTAETTFCRADLDLYKSSSLTAGTFHVEFWNDALTAQVGADSLSQSTSVLGTATVPPAFTPLIWAQPVTLPAGTYWLVLQDDGNIQPASGTGVGKIYWTAASYSSYLTTTFDAFYQASDKSRDFRFHLFEQPKGLLPINMAVDVIVPDGPPAAAAVGASYDLRWKVEGPSSTTELQLLSSTGAQITFANGLKYIATGIAATGTANPVYKWAVPSNLNPGQYLLRACTRFSTTPAVTLCDQSSATFRIGYPLIEVQYPSGGVVSLTSGQSMTWISAGLKSPSTIKIELERPNGTKLSLREDSSVLQGLPLWYIPTSENGSNYRIVISGTDFTGKAISGSSKRFCVTSCTGTTNDILFNFENEAPLQDTLAFPSPQFGVTPNTKPTVTASFKYTASATERGVSGAGLISGTSLPQSQTQGVQWRYAYYRIFENVSATVRANTRLEYFVRPTKGTGAVGVDLLIQKTDGSVVSMRDSGTVDQFGAICHPNRAKFIKNGWNHIVCKIGSTPSLVGAVVKDILFAHDGGTNTEPFEAYVDDIRIFDIGAETIAPTVAISSPATSFSTPQKVVLTATADDASGITRVDFLDGGVVQGADAIKPYTFDWTPTAPKNGSHSWTAKAYDRFGNTATSAPITLNVNLEQTAPTVSLAVSGIQSGITYSISKTALLTATATDNIGINRVELYDNGVLKQSIVGQPNVLPLSLTAMDNGTHSWTAKAFDTSGNFATSNAISYTMNIDSVRPTVSLVAPTSSIRIKDGSPVTFKATATDNVGVGSVIFYKNGVKMAEDGVADATGKYSFTWWYNRSENGIHNWQVAAVDTWNNVSALSPKVQVTIGMPPIEPLLPPPSPNDRAIAIAEPPVPVRSTSSSSSTIVGYQDGLKLKAGQVVAPPVTVSGVTKYQMNFDNSTVDGWVDGPFLAKESAVLATLAAPNIGTFRGDIDGSKNISVTDGVQTLRCSAGLSPCQDGSSNPVLNDPIKRITADCDLNGQVSVSDGVNVLRAAAQLPSTCTNSAAAVEWIVGTSFYRSSINNPNNPRCSNRSIPPSQFCADYYANPRILSVAINGVQQDITFFDFIRSEIDQTQVGTRAIFHDWGTGGPAQTPGVIDNFLVTFSGTFNFSGNRGGVYTFIGKSEEDGINVIIDDSDVIIDRMTDSSRSPRNSRLLTGPHKITVNFLESNGNASMRLDFSDLPIAESTEPMVPSYDHDEWTGDCSDKAHWGLDNEDVFTFSGDWDWGKEIGGWKANNKGMLTLTPGASVTFKWYGTHLFGTVYSDSSRAMHTINDEGTSSYVIPPKSLGEDGKEKDFGEVQLLAGLPEGFHTTVIAAGRETRGDPNAPLLLSYLAPYNANQPCQPDGCGVLNPNCNKPPDQNGGSNGTPTGFGGTGVGVPPMETQQAVSVSFHYDEAVGVPSPPPRAYIDGAEMNTNSPHLRTRASLTTGPHTLRIEQLSGYSVRIHPNTNSFVHPVNDHQPTDTVALNYDGRFIHVSVSYLPNGEMLVQTMALLSNDGEETFHSTNPADASLVSSPRQVLRDLFYRPSAFISGLVSETVMPERAESFGLLGFQWPNCKVKGSAVTPSAHSGFHNAVLSSNGIGVLNLISYATSDWNGVLGGSWVAPSQAVGSDYSPSGFDGAGIIAHVDAYFPYEHNGTIKTLALVPATAVSLTWGPNRSISGGGFTAGYAIENDILINKGELDIVLGYAGVQGLENFYYNAILHEYGHKIGLHHSSLSRVMRDVPASIDEYVSITDDDVQGIVALYGSCVGR